MRTNEGIGKSRDEGRRDERRKIYNYSETPEPLKHGQFILMDDLMDVLLRYGLQQPYIITPEMRTPRYSVDRFFTSTSIWTVQISLDNVDTRFASHARLS